jgi:hypothetical protein
VHRCAAGCATSRATSLKKNEIHTASGRYARVRV